MEKNTDNTDDIHFSKLKYADDFIIHEIPEKLFNNDINFINYNSFSQLGTTNLPTDFNNLTDLEYLDADCSFIHNFKLNNNNFQLFKNKEKKVSILDNTFDNVKMNLIEEIEYKDNFEENLSIVKPKFDDNKTEYDFFSQISLDQTAINFPFNNFKSKNNVNNLSKKNFIKSLKKNTHLLNSRLNEFDYFKKSSNINKQREKDISKINFSNEFFEYEDDYTLLDNPQKDKIKNEMMNIKKINITNIVKEEKKDFLIFEKRKIIDKNKISSGNKLKSPIFYISKFHKRKCSHSNSKTKKNYIKNLVFQDYLKIKDFMDNKLKNPKQVEKNKLKLKNISDNINNLNENNKIETDVLLKRNIDKDCNYNFTNVISKDEKNKLIGMPNNIQIQEFKNKINNTFLKKKTSNRNFRLFDKDVVIKKIMSNFLKFVKIIIEYFLIENKLELIYEIRKNVFEEIFCNLEKCKEFLFGKKIIDFLICKKRNFVNKKINIKNDKMKYKTLSFIDTRIIDVYKFMFLNSGFLINYIYPKIKKDHDQSYYMHFMQFINKIIE